MADTYKKVAAAKQADALSKIPKEWRLSPEILQQISPVSNISVIDIPSSCEILSMTEIKITENYTATALAREIAAGNFTALQVTEAFCKRAAIAQQLVRSSCERKLPS
jgi:amidase